MDIQRKNNNIFRICANRKQKKKQDTVSVGAKLTAASEQRIRPVITQRQVTQRYGRLDLDTEGKQWGTEKQTVI